MGWVPQPGDTVVDRSGITYVLNQLIGEGGQGVVYTTEAEGAAVKISTAASADSQKIEERISSVMRLPVDDLPVALPRSILAFTLKIVWLEHLLNSRRYISLRGLNPGG